MIHDDDLITLMCEVGLHHMMPGALRHDMCIRMILRYRKRIGFLLDFVTSTQHSPPLLLERTFRFPGMTLVSFVSLQGPTSVHRRFQRVRAGVARTSCSAPSSLYADTVSVGAASTDTTRYGKYKSTSPIVSHLGILLSQFRLGQFLR